MKHKGIPNKKAFSMPGIGPSVPPALSSPLKGKVSRADFLKYGKSKKK